MSLLAPVSASADTPAIQGYMAFGEWNLQMKELETDPLASVQKLGTTAKGSEVLALAVGSGEQGRTPAIVVVGGLDGAYPASVELVVRMARGMLDVAEQDEAVRELLSQCTFYFLPCASPDEFSAFYRETPRGAASGNSRPTDDDNDFRTDEDGADDLNGDGWLTVMRVADPSGSWRTHPADPRVMIQADLTRNETGGYELYGEGIDDDGDERWNEDAPGGVKFNHNWTYNYTYFGAGAGPHQVSEPETRAVADFMYAHPEIALVVTLGPEDNLIHPWKPQGGGGGRGAKVSSVLGGDAPYLDYIAEQYRDAVLDEGDLKQIPQSPAGAGSFAEWAYFHFGRWSLMSQGWWPIPEKVDDAAQEDATESETEAVEPEPESEPEPEEEPEDVGDRGKDDLRKIEWMESVDVDGFVDWEVIEHPDFPNRRVEVGGFKPYLFDNPPAGELDGLAERQLGFLIETARLLPRLEFTDIDIEDVGAELYRVSVTVLNTGYLATMSDMGERSRTPYPLYYSMEIPAGATLLEAHSRGRLERLAGNGGASSLSWLVQAEQAGLIKLEVGSPCAGYASIEMDLAHASAAQEGN